MPALAKPPVDSLRPERRAQELLLEWLARWFTGAPLQSATGDQSLPACDLIFGDAFAPDPSVRPQLHGVIAQMPTHSRHWSATDASEWDRVCAYPASGVSYGATPLLTIEETVHGKVRRTLPGRDIRWRAIGSSFVEETLQGDMWVTARTFASTTGLRWVRDGGDYVEMRMDARAELRRFTPVNPVWDGTTLRVSGPLRIMWFARVLSKGQTSQDADFACRAVADGLVQLFNRPDATAALAQKGLRHWKPGGVSLLSMGGVIVRSVTTTCEADYLVPVERAQF